MTEIDLKNSTIMIVDDTRFNLILLNDLLASKGYIVNSFLSGDLALASAIKSPPDLILLDINMPGMNGYETCSAIKEHDHLKDIPVIFISTLSNPEDKIKAFSHGGVDYIQKPFEFSEVNARVETHLKIRLISQKLSEYNHMLENVVDQKVAEISISKIATIEAISSLAEARDDITGSHTKRVQHLSRILSTELYKSNTFHCIDDKFINMIFYASALHDTGKIRTPDTILNKNGILDTLEFEEIAKHSTNGKELLKLVSKIYPDNEYIELGTIIAYNHHEQWNGQGYPNKLKGKEIPLSARIVAICDVYDALRSKRPYKDGLSHEDSMKIIVEGKATHFDPDIVDAFVNSQRVIQDYYTLNI